ncbi:elongation factor TU GTP binding domain-containing protein [Cyclospora cayetanensis]|uniref:Elongation factor TU GTP binding domain-containing protein n=1 Tax=Cyclospora cayetanensis TaxID=88456 RepID=A0A1D3D9L6_9EIME|nr:elongation factor TU GTP binding domain-containing protein [Cyclospora cayetanensis]
MEPKKGLPAATFVRNVCILAHVDHGKTSLSDRLLAVNGFISEASAAKLRFLDSREDEQARQITIKASVVSLLYRRTTDAQEASLPPAAHSHPDGNASDSPLHAGEDFGGPPSGFPPSSSPESVPYMVNIIDCPGHVDFASEVSAGVRLCDGCLLLVDAVEGVCPQTIASLQCALQEGLLPVLVLTKIDRLISTLQLSPGEAVHRAQAIIEQMNAHLHQQICSEAIAAEGKAGGPPSAKGRLAEHSTRLDAASGEPLGPLGDSKGEFIYFDGDVAGKLEFCPSRGQEAG